MSQTEITQAEAQFEKEADRIRKSIRSELEKFLNGVKIINTESRNFKLFSEAYKYFDKKFKDNARLFNAISRKGWLVFHDVKDVAYLLFLYLGMIESLGNSIVNILVMLLVANGRDFHIECRGYRMPRIRHVVSIKEDLEKERVFLGTKLSFLQENGLKVLTSIIDSELRNAIAHLNFTIKEDGFYVKVRKRKGGKEEKPVLIATIIGLRKLWLAIETTRESLNQLAEEKKLTI